MEAIAKLNKLAVSSRKTRLVVDLIRGMEVNKALAQLRHSSKHVALPIEKLVRSAVANWRQHHHKNEEETLPSLYIKYAYVGPAGMLKRIRPAPQGRAHRVRKRSCHVTIIVAPINTTDK